MEKVINWHKYFNLINVWKTCKNAESIPQHEKKNKSPPDNCVTRAMVRKSRGFTEGVSNLGNKTVNSGTSLAVQWLRLHAFNEGGIAGSIPGRGTKILHAAWPQKKKKKDSGFKSVRSGYVTKGLGCPP